MLERLTIRTLKGAALKMNDAYPNEAAARKDLMQRYCVAVDRLAAYEDTGLEPEEVTAIKHALMGREIAKITEFEGIPIQRLQKLAQAEKDGRLVVLPCRVGDAVYIIETVFENGKRKKQNKPSGEQIVSANIDHVTISGTTGKPVFDLCTETENWYYSMEPEQFYLAREEAEAALKKREEMPFLHKVGNAYRRRTEGL